MSEEKLIELIQKLIEAREDPAELIDILYKAIDEVA